MLLSMLSGVKRDHMAHRIQWVPIDGVYAHLCHGTGPRIMPSFGTLKADTLTHSTAGSLDTNYVVNGSAKAVDSTLTLSNTFATVEDIQRKFLTDNRARRFYSVKYL